MIVFASWVPHSNWPCYSVPIQVVPDRPESEANGPVLVYSVPNFLSADGSTEYPGFYILMEFDPRFIEMDDEHTWYSAKAISATQVLIQLLAWPYCLWPNGPNSTGLYTNLVDQLPDAVKYSVNAAHAPFDNKDEVTNAQLESRKWRYILLDFSNAKDIGELSSKSLYSDAGEQEILDYDVISVPKTWDASNNVLSEQDFLGFKVANVSAGGGWKIQRKGVKKSKLAQKLASRGNKTGI